MARFVISGFEIYVAPFAVAGAFPDGDAGDANPTRDTVTKRSGNASAHLATTATTAWIDWNILPSRPVDHGYWGRVYVKIVTPPAAACTLLQIGGAGSTANLNTDGTVSSSLATGTKSAAINDGNWHRVEYYVKPSVTQASRAWELRVDGTSVANGSNQTTESGGVDFVTVGWFASATCNVYVDDVAANDDTGASNNSWCGAGAVALLAPTADSAVGTGWTLGTGTAISGNTGKTAVSNTPPLGVADLAAGSDPKQIRNASSNANVNYDATMTTYTAAGIGASDLINALQCYVATAAPIATSAKAGTVGIVSNPAVANIALGSAGTAGTVWPGAAAGTYPTGWKWSAGTMADAPTVTKGTAPVMRVTQVTASTRIADVCGMFIYVDYAPAAAVAGKKPKAHSNQAAIMRAATR